MLQNLGGQSPREWSDLGGTPDLGRKLEDTMPRGARLNNLPEAELYQLVRLIPGIDLHCHLEAITKDPEVICRIGKQYRLKEQYGVDLPFDDAVRMRALVQVTEHDHSLLDFLKKFDALGKLFASPEVVGAITEEIVKDAAAQNIAYLELRFSPVYMAAAHDLDPERVVEAVLEGAERAAQTSGIKVNLIMIVERQMGLAHAEEIVRLAEKYRQGGERGEGCLGIVAIDLANDEANFPPHPYAPIFQRAKSSGLMVTVHAGEAGGAENVRCAVEDLKADRVGHGPRALEDPAVVQMLIERRVILEMCPTSNEQTEAVKCLSALPFRHFFDLGAGVTINTDDPCVCGVNLADEVVKVIREFGFTLEELKVIYENSVRGAFLSERDRLELHSKVDQGFEAAGKWLAARGAT